MCTKPPRNIQGDAEFVVTVQVPQQLGANVHFVTSVRIFLSYCDPKLHGFGLKWRYADYGFLENLEAPCRRRSCAVAVARRRVPDWGFIGT